jgi:hypothetical protein
MQGWICPGCGRCYSPSTTECRVCGQPSSDTVTIPAGYGPCHHPFTVDSNDGRVCAACGTALPSSTPFEFMTTMPTHD